MWKRCSFPSGGSGVDVENDGVSRDSNRPNWVERVQSEKTMGPALGTNTELMAPVSVALIAVPAFSQSAQLHHKNDQAKQRDQNSKRYLQPEDEPVALHEEYAPVSCDQYSMDCPSNR